MNSKPRSWRLKKLKSPRSYALFLLKRRLYTEAGLIDRLQRRGVEPEEIKQVIEELKAVDLINDIRFARLFIAEKTSLNPMGKQRLYFELLKRGIAKELAKESIEALDEGELNEALQERVKERARHLSGDDQEKKEKILRYLAARGVPYGQAKDLINNSLISEVSE